MLTKNLSAHFLKTYFVNIHKIVPLSRMAVVCSGQFVLRTDRNRCNVHVLVKQMALTSRLRDFKALS